MTNNKKNKIQFVNSSLYRERQRRKLSVKEVAVALKISTLHLNLIEKGYMHVSSKLKPAFIKFYELDSNFFELNSTYVDPIYVAKPDLELDAKMRAQMARPRVKIISSIFSAIGIGVIIGGALLFTKPYRVPRAKWSENFAAVRDATIKNADDETFDAKLLDNYYTIRANNEDDKSMSQIEFSTYAKDTNAPSSFFTFDYLYKKADARPDHKIFPGDRFQIGAYAYNKKKYFYFTFTSLLGDLANKRVNAIIFFTDPGVFTMKKVIVTDGLEIVEYTQTTDMYRRFHTLLFEDKLIDYNISTADNLMSERLGSVIPSDYRFYSCIGECLSISRSYVFSSNSGLNMMLFGSIGVIFFIANLLFSFSASAKPKKEKEEELYVIHRVEYVDMSRYGTFNDSKFSPIFPEFIMRAFGLLILLLSSIGMIWATSSLMNGDINSITKSSQFRLVTSNALVAGTMLLFFIKLDVFHKKTNRDLAENILTLFFMGLIFYIAEILLYFYLTTGGNILTELAKIFVNLLPGNIIWNLMLYSLLFLFLFTVPTKLANKPHRVLLWRLCSVFPTLILAFAFVFEMFLKQYITAPYYISFIFFTKGAVTSAFAILFLYSLFFLQQYTKLKYGEEAAEIYLDSRRYAFDKNIVASIVIVILVLIDLFFRYKIPENSMNLGNNWPLIFLIPFILLYRPHIGKRNGTWDFCYTIMYVVFLASGYIGTIGVFLNALNFNDIIEILH